MKKIAIVGANSYIARNVILRLQQRLPECELNLYDYAEEQVDGQQLAQDAQGVTLVVIGDDPRRSEKQNADSDARPYSK